MASLTSDGMIIPIPRCSNGLYWYTTSNGFELQIIAIAIEMAKGGNLERNWSLNNVKSYLRVYGMNNDIAFSFYKLSYKV